jgi:hypothetical protein
VVSWGIEGSAQRLGAAAATPDCAQLASLTRLLEGSRSPISWEGWHPRRDEVSVLEYNSEKFYEYAPLELYGSPPAGWIHDRGVELGLID